MESKLVKSEEEEAHKEEKKIEEKSSSPLLKKEESVGKSRDDKKGGNDNNETAPSSTSPTPPVAFSPSQHPPSSSSRQHPPAPIMTNRPPSTTSVLSNVSGGATPRTTTTSRRGGRTRCRSPPTMIARPGSTNPSSQSNASGGMDYPSEHPAEDSSRRGREEQASAPTPPSPANPSAAAAAAAFAAKSLSNSAGVRPPPSQWGYDKSVGAVVAAAPADGRDGSDRYGMSHRREGSSRNPPRYDSRYHHPHDSRYDQGRDAYPPQPPASQRNWPEDEHSVRSSSAGRGAYAQSQSIHRRSGDEHHGYRESYYGYREGPSSRSRREDAYGYDDEYERRYGEHHRSHGPPPRSTPYVDERMSNRRGPPPPQPPVADGRTTSPHPPSGYGPPPDHQHRPVRDSHRRDERGGDPYAYSKGGMAPMEGKLPPFDSAGASSLPPNGPVGVPPKRSGMSRVIGTPTPIHYVPRASDHNAAAAAAAAAAANSASTSSSRSRGGSAASVFRGRPDKATPRKSENEGSQDDESPQKILLSLRTPSTSFEEKSPEEKATNGNTRNSKEKNSSRKSPSGSQDPIKHSLSPEEPPQIQHSHQKSSSESNANLFFDVSRRTAPFCRERLVLPR
jgi:hypothetical protein